MELTKKEVLEITAREEELWSKEFRFNIADRKNKPRLRSFGQLCVLD
jgi:hypothetical protein